MSAEVGVQIVAPQPVKSYSQSLLLQRKCSCGGTAGLTSECTECQSKRLLGKPLQTKLRVNEPGDEDEQEADRVADQVMAASAHHVASGASPRIQRFSGQSNGSMDAAPASIDQVLASPGRPLEPAVRRDMEQRFGHDFSRVRVHSDAAAEQSAWDVNANAYTVGENMVFGAGQFAPGTNEGRRLIAHELTHVVQQRGNLERKVQRAMKLEFQTGNFVWAVKDTGAPDPKLLPRKYSPTTVGYREGAGQEKGSEPAFLSVGPHGRPAIKAREAYVEVEGPPVMKEAKDADASKAAQFVKEFRFNTQVDVKDILGKPVTRGQMNLVREKDNSHDPNMVGDFNPNTFEFKYFNLDDTQLDVHLNQEGLFKKDHVKLMKVGKGHRKDVDYHKGAQKVETWKVTFVTDKGEGTIDFNGTPATVEQVGKTEDRETSWKEAQAKNPKVKLEKDYNPGTYERNYYLSTQFDGDKLLPSATKLKVHLSKDGTSFKEGDVDFWEKKKLPRSEQTAIELQSEHGGFLEFETPKWFDDLSELKLRIQDAVDMTDAINAQRDTDKEVTDQTILDAMGISAPDPTDPDRVRVVKWPDGLSTSHLKNLVKDKRSLLVQIVDHEWPAKIQSSYEVSLSQYQTLLSEHDQLNAVDYAAAAISSAQLIFDAGFDEAKALTPAELKKLGLKDLDLTNVDKRDLVNLLGLVQIITDYLIQGQYVDLSSNPAKDIALVMSRTSFYSIYHSILGKTERLLFQLMVKNDTITKTLEAPLNSFLTANKKLGTPDTVASNFAVGNAFVYRTGHQKGAGPKIREWLKSIISGYKEGGKTMTTDKLSPPEQGSKAMGAHKAGSEPGEENIVRFEVRYSQTRFGGQDQKAKDWVKYVEQLFKLAAQRQDTPDNPLTSDVNEAAKTGLKL